jgi:hypothetical protein
MRFPTPILNRPDQVVEDTGQMGDKESERNEEEEKERKRRPGGGKGDVK